MDSVASSPTSQGPTSDLATGVPKALLYVHMNPPTGIEDEFNTWYDEHAADRLTVPGILSAHRYRAVEPEGPRYLACYDLADHSVLQSREYLRLRAEQSKYEEQMLARIPMVDRRVYRSIDSGEPWTAAWTENAPFVLSMAMEPPPELVDDFHAWYAQEHSPMLMEAEGWRRIRRYELVEGTGARFLALHELESLDAIETDKYNAAVSTPWRERVRLYTSRRQRLIFQLLRGFSRPA